MYVKIIRIVEKKKVNDLWKACVVNSLAISKLIYVGSILPIPENNLIKKNEKWYF